MNRFEEMRGFLSAPPPHRISTDPRRRFAPHPIDPPTFEGRVPVKESERVVDAQADSAYFPHADFFA
jgi:hypothetical protein